MKSVAVGKVGRSVLFNSNNWGAIGGDNEAPIFYENLFHANPDVTFYLVGVSDYSRLDHKARERINKHKNVVDAWEGFNEWRKTWEGDDRAERIDYMTHWMKTAPKIDAGLFFMGPTATTNVYGKSHKVTDPDSLANPLIMQAKYAGPVIDFLNEAKLPYAIILNDPRFFPASMRDLFHRPKVILSQYNETIKHKSWRSYADMTWDILDIPSRYKAVETIFLIGKERGKAIVETASSLDSFFGEQLGEEPTGEKDVKFMIVCNEGRPSRYPDLKKYILDNIQDIEIYGKWDERTIGDDPRFKGAKKFNDLQKMLPRVKYTFCIPIKKGWVTAKFWEMAHYGIIPFLHPTYDEQNNLKCPEILRVKDSKDLFKKIEFLEKNPEAYAILRKNIEKMLKDEYYDGSYLNNLTMSTLREIADE